MSRVEHPVLQEELMAYVDGDLQERQASKVARHVEQCRPCADAIADARQVSQWMASWDVEESPERITNRVMTEMTTQSETRTSQSRTEWWTPGRKWFYGLSGLAAVFLLFTVSVPSLLRSRQAAPSETKIFSAVQESPTPAIPSPQTPSGPMVIRKITLVLVTNEF